MIDLSVLLLPCTLVWSLFPQFLESKRSKLLLQLDVAIFIIPLKYCIQWPWMKLFMFSVLICFSGKQYLLLKLEYFYIYTSLYRWMHLTSIVLLMILAQFRLCVKFPLLSRRRWIIMMLILCPDETQTASFCIFIYQKILFLSKICTNSI